MTTARTHARTAAAVLAGVYLLVFGPGVLVALRVVAGSAAPPAATGWPDRVAALEWDAFTVAVVLLVVVRWLPRHAGQVSARMQLARPPAGRLAAATALYVAAATVATWSADAAVSAFHLPSGHYTRLAGGIGGFLTTGAAATAAGVTEEITLVALAAPVMAQLCRGRCARWTVPATLALLIALRLLVHLYYLWGSLFVLVWIPGAYLVYRWAGSVWPLVLGHWVYDWLALTATAFPRTARAVDAVLWLVAGCGVAVFATAWRRAVRPWSCSARWSASRPARRATVSGRGRSRSSAPG
jgi:hypothetical protein